MMIFLAGILAGAVLGMWFAPDTPAGQFLRYYLVDWPLSEFGKFRSYHIIFALLLIGLLMGGGEIAALMGPEFLAGYAIDMAIFLDALIVTCAVSIVSKLRANVAYMRAMLVSMVRRPEAGRSKRIARKSQDRSSANDDEDPAFLPMAA